MKSPHSLALRTAVTILVAIAVLIASCAPGIGYFDDAGANDDRFSDLRPPDDRDTRQTDFRVVNPEPDGPTTIPTGTWTELAVIHEAPPSNAGSDTVAVGPPSCALACIDRAWLSAALSTTDLTLDVETTVDASINFAVGSHPPFLGLDGIPYFSTDVTTASTYVDVQDWTTTVTGLDADTDYHIIVTATDDGGTHAVTGTFRTVTPAAAGLDTFDSHGEAACDFSCIETVILSPGVGADADTVDIEVTTNHPADIVVYFGTELETWVNGLPQLDDIVDQDGGPTTNNRWEGTADGFTPTETYRVAVLAVDDHGGTDIHVEWVNMAPYPRFDLLYVPLRLKVTENGDDIGKGELRFAWRVGDPYNPLHTDSRKRHKMKDGESFYFSGQAQYQVLNVGENELLPDFVITGLEKDNDLLSEFATGGFDYLNPHAGWIPGDDEAYNTAQLHQWAWNGYAGGITVGDLNELQSCGSFVEIDGSHPFADAACIKILTHPAGGPGGEEYPEFWTILAITAQPAESQSLP